MLGCFWILIFQQPIASCFKASSPSSPQFISRQVSGKVNWKTWEWAAQITDNMETLAISTIGIHSSKNGRASRLKNWLYFYIN